MKRLIYADNAATTKMSQAACEAMMRFQLTDFANVSQPYSFARSAKKALKEARETIARCINASPNEIFLLHAERKVIIGLLRDVSVVEYIPH